MAIFDTNIIIDHLRGVSEAKKILEEYSVNEKVGISTITAYELEIGIKNVNEEKGLSLFLSHAEVYSFDLKSAREAATFYKKQKGIGKQLSIGDTLILGTAKANDETFVTQDKDFEGTYESVVIVEKSINRH